MMGKQFRCKHICFRKLFNLPGKRFALFRDWFSLVWFNAKMEALKPCKVSPFSWAF
jgi:hypothetical protein